MDVRHVSMLMLGAGMFVLVRVGHFVCVMVVEFVMRMPVLVDDRHVNMKVCVLLTG